MLLQTVSCTIAGGAGVLYGFIYKSFHLDFFTFALVGIAMTIIFVGGYATQWGTVVLAPILYGVPLLFPPAIQEWRIVIYGAVLVLVLVLKPEGFITRRFVFSIETFLSGSPEEKKYPVRRTYEEEHSEFSSRRRCSFPSSGCQQPAPKEWTIPFLNSLTGAIASIGEYLEWGAERAAKEINDAGGIKGKPVRIVGRRHGAGSAEGLHRDGAPGEGHPRGPRTRARAGHHGGHAHRRGKRDALASPRRPPWSTREKFFPWTISWFPSTQDSAWRRSSRRGRSSSPT